MVKTIYEFNKVRGIVPQYISRDPQVVSNINSDIFDVCKYMIYKGYAHCIEDSESMYFSKEPLGITFNVWNNLEDYYNIIDMNDIQGVE